MVEGDIWFVVLSKGNGVWVPAFAGTTYLLLRRRVPPTPDKSRRVPKTLGHHRGQVFCFIRHAGAGAHGVAVLMRKMCRRLPLLQRAGAFHEQFSEMHDAEIGRAEMLAGAVG